MDNLLSVLIWLPIAGGVVLLAMGDANDAASPRANAMRWTAFAVSALTFILSIGLYARFDKTTADMQFVERVPWIDAIDVWYYLGVDGFSAPLILLTTFITPLVVIAGWDVIKARPAQYFAAFLILEGLMNGVFSALDGLLFYVFWEAMLIPMYFIIGIWGGQRRIYAAVKFFIFTMVGSVFMLVGILYLYFQAGSMDLAAFLEVPLARDVQLWLFAAFFLAFALVLVKRAHRETDTDDMDSLRSTDEQP